MYASAADVLNLLHQHITQYYNMRDVPIITQLYYTSILYWFNVCKSKLKS